METIVSVDDIKPSKENMINLPREESSVEGILSGAASGEGKDKRLAQRRHNRRIVQMAVPVFNDNVREAMQKLNEFDEKEWEDEMKWYSG